MMRRSVIFFALFSLIFTERLGAQEGKPSEPRHITLE